MTRTLDGLESALAVLGLSSTPYWRNFTYWRSEKVTPSIVTMAISLTVYANVKV